MKQLANLRAESIDMPDIKLPRLVQSRFGSGGIAITAEMIYVYLNQSAVSIPVSEIARLAKEADPRVDITAEGIKVARKAIKARR